MCVCVCVRERERTREASEFLINMFMLDLLLTRTQFSSKCVILLLSDLANGKNYVTLHFELMRETF